MPLTEINFDGIVGPSHNYAGLSLGNLAASRHGGQTSRPRAAALEGLAKMRANLSLGLTQGLLLPHDRPDEHWLAQLGYLGAAEAKAAPEFGRASFRERVCQYVLISVVAVSLKSSLFSISFLH